MDHLDHLDQGKEFKELERSRQPIAAGPPGPAFPFWSDVDGWRARYRRAELLEPKRIVLGAWARAAGGELRDGVLVLPASLPRSLAVAEMTANARYCGFKVETADIPYPPALCDRCGEPVPVNAKLCEVCRWLADKPRQVRTDLATELDEEPEEPRFNPNACIYCGDHCPPSDLENILMLDGQWEHLSCALRASRTRARDPEPKVDTFGRMPA